MDRHFLAVRNEVNIILTGPPGTGKKSFLKTLTNNRVVIPESDESISPVHTLSFTSNGQIFRITLWYVRNLERAVKQIKLICLYKKLNSVVIFWYAIDDPQSLTRLSENYITVLRQKGRFPFLSLLVGNKVDARLDVLRPCVSFEKGLEIKTSFQLSDFIECSALVRESIMKIFLQAACIALGLEDE